MGSPVYVTKLDVATNTVTLGPKQELDSDRLTASQVRWLIDPPTGPQQVSVKIRYAHQAAPAMLETFGPDRVQVRFDQPQSAITPGQAVVFYDDDVVLGGGWIE